MRLLLSIYGSHGSRGDIEPMVGVAAPVRALRAEASVCATEDAA